jgi:hypothetical protein
MQLIGGLAEQEQDFFKKRAYYKAADAIRDASFPIESGAQRSNERLSRRRRHAGSALQLPTPVNCLLYL